jgi:thioredoxin reductase (NADPH)
MAEPELHAAAFPTLDDDQVATLGRCTSASARTVPDGTVLFATGDSDAQFFVVKSGEVAIIDYTGAEPHTLVVHRKGQFTGDVSHLTGDPAVVTAVTRGECELYQIAPDDLRRMLNQCPTLSDVILQAFISRRQLLRASPDFTGLRVIGSRYSQDTFRVRDFLAKNRVPFTWIDLEADPQVDALLRQFGVTEADTPVVA